MKYLLLFVALVFASKHNLGSDQELFKQNAYHSILIKIEEDEFEYAKASVSSEYFGVSYNKKNSRWIAYRRSKNEKKMVYNGYYDNEETAAHASDTLARKLMANDEHHKLNFPDDDTEVYAEEKTISSQYIGVSYNGTNSGWGAYRWSKIRQKTVNNGTYKDEETAAHASDTLARKLMANGEQNHKLNFPDDDTEVHAKTKQTSKYIGVSYANPTWRTYRWSPNSKKNFYNGQYKDEEAAAQASDTLARKLIANGDTNLKLNFPDDAKLRKKRKRSEDLNRSQTDGTFGKFE